MFTQHIYIVVVELEGKGYPLAKKAKKDKRVNGEK